MESRRVARGLELYKIHAVPRILAERNEMQQTISQSMADLCAGLRWARFSPDQMAFWAQLSQRCKLESGCASECDIEYALREQTYLKFDTYSATASDAATQQIYPTRSTPVMDLDGQADNHQEGAHGASVLSQTILIDINDGHCESTINGGAEPNMETNDGRDELTDNNRTETTQAQTPTEPLDDSAENMRALGSLVAAFQLDDILPQKKTAFCAALRAYFATDGFKLFKYHALHAVNNGFNDITAADSDDRLWSFWKLVVQPGEKKYWASQTRLFHQALNSNDLSALHFIDVSSQVGRSIEIRKRASKLISKTGSLRSACDLRQATDIMHGQSLSDSESVEAAEFNAKVDNLKPVHSRFQALRLIHGDPLSTSTSPGVAIEKILLHLRQVISQHPNLKLRCRVDHVRFDFSPACTMIMGIGPRLHAAKDDLIANSNVRESFPSALDRFDQILRAFIFINKWHLAVRELQRQSGIAITFGSIDKHTYTKDHVSCLTFLGPKRIKTLDYKSANRARMVDMILDVIRAHAEKVGLPEFPADAKRAHDAMNNESFKLDLLGVFDRPHSSIHEYEDLLEQRLHALHVACHGRLRLNENKGA